MKGIILSGILCLAPALPAQAQEGRDFASHVEISCTSDDRHGSSGDCDIDIRRGGIPGLFRPRGFFLSQGKRFPFRDFLHHGQEQDPEIARTYEAELKAEGRLRKLLDKYDVADSRSQKNDLREQIRKNLNLIFEARLKREELVANRKAKAAARAKKRVEKRRKAKKAIVERRIGKLLGEDSTFEW